MPLNKAKGRIVGEAGQRLNSEKVPLGGTRRRMVNLIAANYRLIGE